MKKGVAVLLLSVLTVLFACAAGAAEITTVEYADCSLAANRAFSSKFYIPTGFKLLAKSDESKPFGFQAVAFKHLATGIVVMAVSGSNGGDPGDLLSNMGVFASEISSLKEAIANLLSHKTDDDKTLDFLRKMTLKKPSEWLFGQLREAVDFFKRVSFVAHAANVFDFLHRNPLESVRHNDSAVNIHLTGHSLGGYLVQILSARNGNYGETFNAPGASGFLQGAAANTVDHFRRHDLVGVYGRHAGKLRAYPDIPIQWANFPKPFFIRNHLMEDFLRDLKTGMAPLTEKLPE